MMVRAPSAPPQMVTATVSTMLGLENMHMTLKGSQGIEFHDVPGSPASWGNFTSLANEAAAALGK